VIQAVVNTVIILWVSIQVRHFLDQLNHYQLFDKSLHTTVMYDNIHSDAFFHLCCLPKAPSSGEELEVPTFSSNATKHMVRLATTVNVYSCS